MYLDFRPLLRRTFAELSRKYPYPAISRGRIEGKANTRGLGDWLSQSLTFGNLAVACGACFSRLQKASLGSDSGRMRQVQGCAQRPLDRSPYIYIYIVYIYNINMFKYIYLYCIYLLMSSSVLFHAPMIQPFHPQPSKRKGRRRVHGIR